MSSFASRILLLTCASTLVATPAGAAALYRATVLTERNDHQPIVQGLGNNGRVLLWNVFETPGTSEYAVYNSQDGTIAPMAVEHAGVTTAFTPQHMSANGRMTIGWVGGKPALSDDGRITELPAWGQAVNDSGQVAVVNFAPNASTSSIVSNGTVTPLGVVPGYDTTVISALNNSGQGAGTASRYLHGGGEYRSEPVYFDGRNYIPLGTGGWYGGASGINNKGDVIGVATDASNTEIAYVSHKGGPLVPLYAPGGDIWMVNPASINDNAQIVGRMMNSRLAAAFLHENGVLTDLNKLLSPSANIRVIDAYFINDLSQIVAKGYLEGEEWPRLFLLTPEGQPMPVAPGTPLQIVPEPSTLVVFALVLVGAAARRRRKIA